MPDQRGPQNCVSVSLFGHNCEVFGATDFFFFFFLVSLLLFRISI